jgi:vancomycin permeability regulator SanA
MVMKKYNNKEKKKSNLISIAGASIAGIDLLVIYYIKYKIQGLSISSFNLFYIGNILNLIFSAALVLGLIVNIFIKNKLSDKVILTCSIIMTLFLAAGILNEFIKFPLPKIYMVEHSFRDILNGILFTSYQFVNFIFLSIIWINMTGGRGLLFLNATVDAAIIMILFLIFAFIYINQIKNLNKINIYADNVAVVLGAAVWTNNVPSPSLASRAEKAHELYKSGVVKKIQLTGGNAPGELSEAEVACRYLKLKGVNPDDMWIEKKTSNTAEQVRYIKEELIDKKQIKNIIIISNSYHLTRIYEICKFFNITAGIEASELALGFDKAIYYKLRESIALLEFWFFAL